MYIPAELFEKTAHFTFFRTHEQQPITSTSPRAFDMTCLFLMIFWSRHNPTKNFHIIVQILRNCFIFMSMHTFVTCMIANVFSIYCKFQKCQTKWKKSKNEKITLKTLKSSSLKSETIPFSGPSSSTKSTLECASRNTTCCGVEEKPNHKAFGSIEMNILAITNPTRMPLKSGPNCLRLVMFRTPKCIINGNQNLLLNM